MDASREPTPPTRDLRIAGYRPLLPPTILMEELPLPPEGAATVHKSRQDIVDILDRKDDRLMVVVGPCSVHDTKAAREYAQLLKEQAAVFSRDLYLVMRVYFEKPRTTVGWRGLISDPHLDGSFAVNDGLRLARQLLLDVVALGLPTGCEFLDPISPQFFADTVAWAAIGARTTESQVHRNLASGLSMPVGFKNGTGGSVQMAIDAIRAAGRSHSFLSVTEQGLAAIVTTRSNPDCHIVLRGGRTGPNHNADSVQQTLESLHTSGLPARVMIDASHDNSRKDYRRQPTVASEIGAQVAEGERGIVGVMLESFLLEGRQELENPAQLVYGQSITDSCMNWNTTLQVLHELAEAVQSRRARMS